MKWIGAGVLVSLLSANGAGAASFDCQKVGSPFEKAVCADPVLSKADESLAATYRGDRAALSPPGKAVLQRSQRSWLAYARTLCRPGDTPLDATQWETYGESTSPDVRVARCLEQSYRDRQALLSGAVVHLGGRTFLQTTTYEVRPARLPDYVKGPQAAHWIVTTVQIDAPKSPAEVAWNSAISDALADAAGHPGDEVADDGATDGDFSVKLVSGTPDFIGAQLLTGVYGKGQAHGQYSSESQLFLLKSRRPLVAGDVFQFAKGWKAVLSRCVFQRLPAEWRKPDYVEAVSATAANPRSWSILPEGLEIQFDPYAINGYIPPRPVLAPWSDLRSVLRRDLPFKLIELQAARQ